MGEPATTRPPTHWRDFRGQRVGLSVDGGAHPVCGLIKEGSVEPASAEAITATGKNRSYSLSLRLMSTASASAASSCRLSMRAPLLGTTQSHDHRLQLLQLQSYRFDYARVQAMNLPIGSGAIESLIRQVVNLHLKGNGKFWLPEHAEILLQGRCYWAAGQWWQS